MTPIAQVALGTAVASCIPRAAAAAAGGHPGYLVAGGLCGCLPDLIDDVLATVGRRPDVRIVPDPLAPRNCDIAAGLALAAGRALAVGRPVRAHIAAPAVREGVYLCCRVALLPSAREVEISFHHATPHAPAVDEDGEASRGAPQRAVFPCGLFVEDTAVQAARPERGLWIELRPVDRHAVEVVFEPRRRGASHSLAAVAAAACVGWAVADRTAACVAAAAILSHLAGDNVRRRGVAWGYPFISRRVCLLRSRAAQWMSGTLSAVVGALAVAGWNLHGAVAGPLPPRAAAGLRVALLGVIAFGMAARAAGRRVGAIAAAGRQKAARRRGARPYRVAPSAAGTARSGR